MPTQQTTYNSRVTDEALEKKFRDTFKSQGGAELVDDLYAQGVIVPIVDFTAAAQGSELRSDLQTAWDFATGHNQISNTTTTVITTPGFWKIDLVFTVTDAAGGGVGTMGRISINDGATSNVIWAFSRGVGTTEPSLGIAVESFITFLRSGDQIDVFSNNTESVFDIWYRQVADVSGNLVSPLGFTSS